MAGKTTDEDIKCMNPSNPCSALPETADAIVIADPAGAVYQSPGGASINQAGMGVTEKMRQGGILEKPMTWAITKKVRRERKMATPVIMYAFRCHPIRIPIHRPTRTRNISIVFGEGACKKKTFAGCSSIWTFAKDRE